MKPRSFFLRLFVGNLLLVALTVALAALAFYRAVNHRVQESHRDAQVRLLHLAHHYVQRAWPLGSVDNELYRRLMPPPEMRLTIIDRSSKVLADSWADPAQMVNHDTPDRKELQAALAGKEGEDTRPSGTLNVPFRYMALPVERDGQVLGAVRVAMAVRAILKDETFIRRTLLWAGGSAILIASLLALLVGWVWSKPLRQITHTARKIAAGNLTYRAQISGSAELAQLGSALNQMRDSLAGQIRLSAAQRQNLQTVVANLREGVIAVARDGRIVLMNDSAVRLLAPSAEQTAGQHFQTVIHMVEAVQLIHDVLETTGSIERQIEIDVPQGHRVLYAAASALAPTADNEIAVLLVVRDVTEEARTAAMKAEFVANASHELRTPLATIRAAVESLEMIGPQDAEAFGKFVAILSRQVARLESMTKDLLDLHIVERGRDKLRLEEMDLSRLGRWVEEQFAPRSREKGVELKVRTDGSALPFRSDWMLLQLILQNLIENAIRFTPAQGQVECELLDQDAHLLVRVRDTGCGIPPAMQERVFERFFQADAARSGDARIRGTGLGLAIVKHATERLGGKITLQSDVGRGTTVTVQVPKR